MPKTSRKRIKKLKNRRIEDKKSGTWLPAEKTDTRRIIPGDLETDNSFKRKSSKEKALLKVL